MGPGTPALEPQERIPPGTGWEVTPTTPVSHRLRIMVDCQPPMNVEAPTPPLDPRSFHVPAGLPAPAQPEPAPTRRRRRWPWVVVPIAAVLVLLGLVFSIIAWSTWSGIERVDMEGALGGEGTGNQLSAGGYRLP